MAQHPFIQLPPDSTGKRLITKTLIELEYKDLTGDLQVSDTLSGSTSGEIGKVVKIAASSPTAGILTLVANDSFTVNSLSIGETLTAIGVPPSGVCTLVSFSPLYVSKTVNVGNNNPEYGQAIDVKGAASVRFSEGSPLFDAFGGQKVSQPNTIGVYDFSSDGCYGLFTVEKTGAATDTYNPTASCVELTCTGAAGDSVIRTTNKYHFYWPGNGNTAIMSAALSDNGVAGNVRRMGIFDESDGLFFEMYGTQVNAVLRSSTSGSVVNNKVPQQQWNVDRLDGTGLSGVTADFSKAIVYWIDYQWLGAGKVRFGILGPDGSRIVCHEFQNSGKNLYPYMRTGSLPIRAENFNLEATGATTQLRMSCLVVKTDGLVDYTYYRNCSLHPEKTISTDNTPLISIKAAPTYQGKHNGTNVFVESYSCFVKNGAVRLDFCWPITLVGSTFAEDLGTILVDTAATSAVIDDDYWLYVSYYLCPGCHHIDLRSLFEKNDEGIIANIDGTAWEWNVVASPIDGTPTVQGSLTFKELR